MTHIFLTGQPGVGKSTLVQRVLEQLGSAGVIARGFYTQEVRRGGERVGFDVITLDGRRGPLARAGTAARYAVDVASFERLALPELKQQPGVQLYAIDEVGAMELKSSAFFPAVEALLDAAPLVLGTVPVARYGRTIPQVEAIKQRPDVELITLTKKNRNQQTAAVLAAVRHQLAAASGDSDAAGT